MESADAQTEPVRSASSSSPARAPATTPLSGRGKANGKGKARHVISGVLQTLFHLGYPLAVYVAYTRLETRALALLLLGLYLLSAAFRFRGSGAEIWALVRQHLGLVVLIGLAVATGNKTVLLFVPIIVNLYLLATFSASLRNGPPMAERFARMVEDDLPDFTLPYCRRVTVLWCAFLGLNATCIVLLALVAPVEWWALYTGLISYVLIGCLLGGEFIVRKLWFRHYDDSPTDRVFGWAFPPHRTANGRRSLEYARRRLAGSDPPR